MLIDVLSLYFLKNNMKCPIFYNGVCIFLQEITFVFCTDFLKKHFGAKSCYSEIPISLIIFWSDLVSTIDILIAVIDIDIVTYLLKKYCIENCKH